MQPNMASAASSSASVAPSREGALPCPPEEELLGCPPTCQHDCRAAVCAAHCCSYWPDHHAQAFTDPPRPAACPTHRPDSLLLLLGIFSMAAPGAEARRGDIRSLVLAPAGPAGRMSHVFVLGESGGNGTSAAEVALAQEERRHGDLLLLRVRENMNAGKTLEYFVAVAHCWRAAAAPSWVAKADDDSFVNLPVLLRALEPLRGVRDGQFGVRIVGADRVVLDCAYNSRELAPMCGSCEPENGAYRVDAADRRFCKWAGQLYGFTTDVVRWIAASAPALRASRMGLYAGHEDAVAARWLRLGHRGKRAFAIGPSISLPGWNRLWANGSRRAGFEPSCQSWWQRAVVVHRLKLDRDLRMVAACVERHGRGRRPLRSCAAPARSGERRAAVEEREALPRRVPGARYVRRVGDWVWREKARVGKSFGH